MKILRKTYIFIFLAFITCILSACWDKGTLNEISINQEPTFTIFAKDSEAKLDGLKINVKYSAGSEVLDLNNKNITYDEIDTSYLGKQKININYTFKNVTKSTSIVVEIKDAICSLNNKMYPTLDYAIKNIKEKSSGTIKILNTTLDKDLLKAEVNNKTVIINDDRENVDNYPILSITNGSYFYEGYFNKGNTYKYKTSVNLTCGKYEVNSLGDIKLAESKGKVVVDTVKNLVIGTEKTTKNNGELIVYNCNEIEVMSTCNVLKVYDYKGKNLVTEKNKRIILSQNACIKTFLVFNDKYVTENQKIFFAGNNLYVKDYLAPEGMYLDFLQNLDEFKCDNEEVKLKIKDDMLIININKSISKLTTINLYKEKNEILKIYLIQKENNLIQFIIESI